MSGGLAVGLVTDLDTMVSGWVPVERSVYLGRRTVANLDQEMRRVIYLPLASATACIRCILPHNLKEHYLA